MAADDNSPLQLWLRPRPPDNRCPSPSPSFSSSSSSASPTSSSSISSRHRQMSAQCAAPAAPMTDLDAARALADFAHMALLERSDAAGRGARRSSSTRKRAEYHEAGDVGEAAGTSGGGGTARQRIDGKAQEGGDRNHRHGTRPLALDLNQNAISSPSEEHQPQTVTSGSTPEEQQHPHLGLNSFTDQPLKVEHAGGVRLPFGAAAARPKQSISEAEKEAKRLRRVLANRESARQTIRRRQALREELTRKADSLSQENETMKKEKELMVNEYKLLKEINSRLKEKMEERLQHEAENPQPPEHAPAAEDPPPQRFPTPSGRHSAAAAAAAAPLLHQQQERFPPFVPFPWPHPHLQLVSPFNLVKIEPNSKNVNLGCCYDQGAFQAAASALYVPPAAAYPAMFHPQYQPLFGNACELEGVGENPHRSPPPVDTTGCDSSRTLIPPEPAKAKAKAVVEEPPQCGRTTAVYMEPKAKAKAPLDRSSGKVFSLVVPEASSSSAKNKKQTADMNPEKRPLLFGTATGTGNRTHHHHHQPSLPPVLNDKAVPIHSILPQDAVVATRENHNLPDRGAANDAAVDRRQKESQEHLLKKAMDAAAARKRRRELTKLKHQYHQQRWKI